MFDFELKIHDASDFHEKYKLENMILNENKIFKEHVFEERIISKKHDFGKNLLTINHVLLQYTP